MKTTIITGTASGSGKTTLLIEIVKNIRTITNRIGVIKYSINDNLREQIVTDDPAIINKEGTDTALIAKAGSEQTVFIKSSRINFEESLIEAKKILKDINYLLVEGNSAAKYLSSDLIIYLDNSELEMKKSAEEVKKKADIIIDSQDILNGKKLSEIPFKFNLDKINCAKAMLIAEVVNRKPIVIGKKLNREKVKLRGCQLGFF